jgi:hypothetical protein
MFGVKRRLPDHDSAKFILTGPVVAAVRGPSGLAKLIASANQRARSDLCVLSKNMPLARLALRPVPGRIRRMLAEFKRVKQEGGATRRRWFQDDVMELIVWYGDGAGPEGFQICYPGPGREEHALTWLPGSGFSHARVDTGDARPDKNMTPILVKAGAVPWPQVEVAFAERSAELEPAIRDFVSLRLHRRDA